MNKSKELPANGAVIVLALLPLIALADADDADIHKLEEKVSALESAAQNNQNAAREAFMAQKEAIKLNGFFTAAMAKNDGGSESLKGVGSDLNTNADSMLGLQISMRATDDLSLTTQFVSRGLELHDTITEWAYIGYHATQFDLIQAGRFRFPYYLLSETLEVGFAYPWVRPPIEVYNVPTDSLEGFEWTHIDNFHGWDTQISLYFGRAIGEENQYADVSYALDNAWGTALQLNKEEWTFRVAYHVGKLDVVQSQADGSTAQLLDAMEQVTAGAKLINSISPQYNLRTKYEVPMHNILGEYISAAAQYDDFSWLLMMEVAHLTISPSLQPAGSSGYILLGYHLDRWMPNITYAKYYTDARSDHLRNLYTSNLTAFQAALLDLNQVEKASDISTLIGSLQAMTQTQQSYTLGLNYDLTSSTKLKFEAAYYDGFKGTPGRFDGDPGKHTAIYSFAVDAVF